MTSVEWLWEQIDGIIPYQDINKSELFNGVLKQAKEMHKQEVTNCNQSEISKEKTIELLLDFQIYLHNKGLIDNHSWEWEKAAKNYYKCVTK